jgi:Mn-dependent DtxR family transcriptional regulator
MRKLRRLGLVERLEEGLYKLTEEGEKVAESA